MLLQGLSYFNNKNILNRGVEKKYKKRLSSFFLIIFTMSFRSNATKVKIINVQILIFIALLSSCDTTETHQSNLAEILKNDWDFQIKENPLFATSAGVHDYNHLLPSVASEDQQRRNLYNQALLGEINAIDIETLEKNEWVNYQLFKYQLENRLANFKFKAYLIPIQADGGFHTGFARLRFNVPLKTESDYDNYISRLLAYPEYVNQHIELMRLGIEEGITLPKVVLNGYEGTISGHVVDDPDQSVFYEPFENFPATFSEEIKSMFIEEGSRAVMEGAVEGYKQFLSFMVEEYIPGARTTIGASELPNGEEYYNQRLQYFTTLPMTVEEVHNKGLEEVARIKAEMQEIIEQVGFEGSFKDFLEFLRTDERFYAKTPEELLKEATYIAKKMDGKLPSLFGKLPRLPYGVEPVPDEIAPKYTGGRYVPAPKGGTRAGYYWVNTYKLENRPLYVMESLTLHEAVPGHHLQGSLSRELENLPDFRSRMYISAFGEGWGLYSEWLGLEAGFYQDPYSNFGRLTYEMWRACRLVVDTGIHAKGWTRDQVINYLSENTALSIHEITTETDRYIAWPGQALSYKIGEMTIKRLRQKAEEELGESFDVREFHDKVLENGAVTLPILEQIIDDYISFKSKR